MFIEVCLLSLGLHTGSRLWHKITGTTTPGLPGEGMPDRVSATEGPKDGRKGGRPGAIRALATKMDNACQTSFRRRIDPLLSGGSRQRQIAELASDTDRHPAVSDREKGINRSLALSVATVGIAVAGHFLWSPLLILSTVTAVGMMYPMYARVWETLVRERRIGLDFLAILYVTGFWVMGYFVFGALACFLALAGYKAVFRMEGRSREGLADVFGRQPRTVWVVAADGTEVSIPFEKLEAGDVIVVNAGEPIPADGTVTGGIGSVDQHTLTGEAQPVEREPGDPVLASTLLLTGRLLVRVERAGADTTAARITQILTRTAEHQTETETRGTDLADRTVLPNLGVSLLALPLVGPRGAVAALGAGFGINMRVVSMLGMMNHLTIASRRNILIKDGRALERLGAVDTFVFDKTGTLTLEQPRVAKIRLCRDGLTEDDLLTHAAAAEFRQPHPIAKAILAEAEERGLILPEIDEAAYEVGHGIRVTMGDTLVRVGSERFMAREGIVVPDRVRDLTDESREHGHSLVMVATDDRLAGVLELHTAIRPEAGAVISDLRRRGISTAIISGDQELPTEELARTLGVDEWHAGVLPDDKAALIRAMQEGGRVVCYVGDGINDAIALRQADVSVSLRGATTIATDAAQIVMMGRSLERLGWLPDLARQFDRTLRTGFLTTMVPGAICIGGVFLLHFGIYAAEFLFQVGLFSGLGVAMRPLLADEGEEPDDRRN